MKVEDEMRVDEELRRAFEPVDPGEAFTQRVLDRVERERGWRATWRVMLALAASLIVAVGGATWVRHVRYVEEGERARAQVLTALRVASEKLSVVRSAVLDVQEVR